MAHVSLVDDVELHEVVLLLTRLLGQNVAVESMLSLQLTRSGKSKSLFGTGISLYFWHFLLYLIVLLMSGYVIPDATRIFLLT